MMLLGRDDTPDQFAGELSEPPREPTRSSPAGGYPEPLELLTLFVSCIHLRL